MLKYNFGRSMIANIQACMSWINFLLPDAKNTRAAIQSQIDEQTELCGEQEYRICLLELGVSENDL